MDFILEHNEDPIPDPTSVATATSSAQPRSGPIGEEDEEDAAALGLQLDAVADVEARVSRNSFDESWAILKHLTCQSIKCSQCGKIFKNTALANFHAEKSGHDQFEESVEEVLFLLTMLTLLLQLIMVLRSNHSRRRRDSKSWLGCAKR